MGLPDSFLRSIFPCVLPATGTIQELQNSIKKNISHFNSQDPSLPSEHLAEEEVARLSGELEWLREETRHGDRKVEELQDQVFWISCTMFCFR